jgi:hypothetical protein
LHFKLFIWEHRLGFWVWGLDTIIAGQVAHEDLSTTKEKVQARSTHRKKKTTASTPAPYIPPLNTPPGNGLRIASPSKESQGPSLVDNNLKLEVEFSSNMVVEMQESVARKARRMVIGRIIGSRPTIKVFHNCLKLHLSTSFISATLLTHGFFKALFSNEGAKTTRKIIAVEWNGMSFSFCRYVSNFDANA